MDQSNTYVYRPYPRRLYLDGDVNQHSLVVEDEHAEQVHRARGYRKAYEPADPKTTLVIPTLGGGDDKPKGKKGKKAATAASSITPSGESPEDDEDDGEGGDDGAGDGSS